MFSHFPAGLGLGGGGLTGNRLGLGGGAGMGVASTGAFSTPLFNRGAVGTSQAGLGLGTGGLGLGTGGAGLGGLGGEQDHVTFECVYVARLLPFLHSTIY